MTRRPERYYSPMNGESSSTFAGNDDEDEDMRMSAHEDDIEVSPVERDDEDDDAMAAVGETTTTTTSPPPPPVALTAASSSSSSWRRRKDVRVLLILVGITFVLIGAAIGVGLVIASNGDANSSSSSISSEENSASQPPPPPRQHDEDGSSGYLSNDVTASPTITNVPTPTPSSPSSSPPLLVTSSSSMSPVSSSSMSSSSLRPSVSWGNMREDDGSCSDVAFPDRPVSSSSSSSSCSYVPRDVVTLSSSVAQFDVEGEGGWGEGEEGNKLSGGTSTIDDDLAVFVSYDIDGRAGGIWIAERRGGRMMNATTTTTAAAGGDGWEQVHVVGGEMVDGGEGEGVDGDQLGWSVSASSIGGTIVIGAPGYLGKDVPNVRGDGWVWRGRGRVIVASRNGEEVGGTTTWCDDDDDDEAGAAVLVPLDANDDAGFGNSVDVVRGGGCGSCVIVVGSWHDRESRGSVHVYAKEVDDDVSWTEIQKIAPDDSRTSQSEGLHGNYGYTVSLSRDGTYLAVKAPYDSYLGSYDYYDPNRGVTYVYKRGTDGTYGDRRSLCTPEMTQVGSHHRDVVFLDDFLLVGAPGRNGVYVFRLDDDTGNYVPSALLVPSDGGAVDFGIRVDGGGNEAMVSDIGGGRSYLFAYDDIDGVWREKAIFEMGGEGSVMSSYGDAVAEHVPRSFASDGMAYSGNVSFYDLVCEE